MALPLVLNLLVIIVWGNAHSCPSGECQCGACGQGRGVFGWDGCRLLLSVSEPYPTAFDQVCVYAVRYWRAVPC